MDETIAQHPPEATDVDGIEPEDEPRAVDRQQVGVPVSWRVPRSDGPLGRSQSRQRPDDLGSAILHDLSVTGARLLLPVDDDIAVGSLIQLEVDGEWAGAQVAWIGPSPHPAAQWCGVLFVHPGATFTAAIFGAMEAANPA